MKEKILIIEDDNDINELLKDMLDDNGYETQSAYSGTEGLLQLKLNRFDLVLLDLMLPGKSGDEILSLIRAKSDIPVIIISAREEIGLKAKILRLGADDFVSKPFDIDEVLARIEVNLKRSIKSRTVGEKIYSYGEVKVLEESRTVYVNSNKIELTQIEFDILNLLVKYPDKVFSKVNLFKSIWGEDFICDDNTITVHISNIRNKIKKAGTSEKYIKTIWGIGYKLNGN